MCIFLILYMNFISFNATLEDDNSNLGCHYTISNGEGDKY